MAPHGGSFVETSSHKCSILLVSGPTPTTVPGTRVKLDEGQIRETEHVQHRTLVIGYHRFEILEIFPRLGKIILRNLWKELSDLRKEFNGVFISLIQDRIKYKLEERVKADEAITYIDTLVNLELPEEKRKLDYEEIASLCCEFLGAANDTMSNALQWIMACLVKYPSIHKNATINFLVGEMGLDPNVWDDPMVFSLSQRDFW